MIRVQMIYDQRFMIRVLQRGRWNTMEEWMEGCGEVYTIMTASTNPPKKKMTIIIINCISYSMPRSIQYLNMYILYIYIYIYIHTHTHIYIYFIFFIKILNIAWIIQAQEDQQFVQVIQILGWPKSSFRAFLHHLMENPNEFFGQPNINVEPGIMANYGNWDIPI